MREIVLASTNPGKRAELDFLLKPLGVRVLSPSDVGGLPEVVEDQDSFSGNAHKKAASAAKASGRWALADDSGLEVDYLDGAPGIHSARYAGEDANDARNNAKLLADLHGVPTKDRQANFTCAVIIAAPNGDTIYASGSHCFGRILEEPRGTMGFGYDPLFLFTEEGNPECGRTFAQLSLAEKAEISHRGRAMSGLVEFLPSLLESAENGE